jgi:hypothetical protein
MPMGHCGRNRNTIGVHDIENVHFSSFIFFRGREEKFVRRNQYLQTTSPRIPSGSNCWKREKIMKFHSTGRVGGYWPISFFSLLFQNLNKERNKISKLTWAQCEVSRLWIRNLPRVERQPVKHKRNQLFNTLISPIHLNGTEKVFKLLLHKSPHP